MNSLFPSILPDGEDFVDDAYTRDELDRKDWDDLRRIATDHPTDEVNGRSSREEIIDGLAGKQRL